MKTIKLVRCLSIGLIASLGMGLLSGCTEENVEYNIEGVTEADRKETNDKKGGVEQFADAPSWNEMWTIQREEGEPVSVEIDADIRIPKVEQMSVVEVAVPEMDAEYKKKIARKIFGNEDVYYNDISHLEGQEPENNNDVYTLVEAYDANKYIGKYNGVLYELSFSEEKYKVVMDKSWTCLSKKIQWSPKNIYEVCPKEYGILQDLSYCPQEFNSGRFRENGCDLSEEEAEKIARKYVADMGMEYSVLTGTKNIEWFGIPKTGESLEESPTNGYVFTYEYGLDDVSFVEFGADSEYANLPANSLKKEKIEYSMSARMNVYITDKGVIQIEVYNPVETVGVLENVELLPLETIQGIIKEQMQEKYESFRFYNFGEEANMHDYNAMELIYFRVKDKKNTGHYSYIPAWRLSGLIETGGLGVKMICNPVIINAIDGSVIDMYNEI